MNLTITTVNQKTICIECDDDITDIRLSGNEVVSTHPPHPPEDKMKEEFRRGYLVTSEDEIRPESELQSLESYQKNKVLKSIRETPRLTPYNSYSMGNDIDFNKPRCNPFDRSTSHGIERYMAMEKFVRETGDFIPCIRGLSEEEVFDIVKNIRPASIIPGIEMYYCEGGHFDYDTSTKKWSYTKS